MNIFAHRNYRGREVFQLNTDKASIYSNETLEFTESVRAFKLLVLTEEEDLFTLSSGTGDTLSAFITLEDMNTKLIWGNSSIECMSKPDYALPSFFGKYALFLALSEGYGVYFVNATEPTIEILSRKSPNPTLIDLESFMDTAHSFLASDDLEAAQAFIKVLESNEKLV